MNMRQMALFFLILIFGFGATWIGCSDNHEFVTQYDPNNNLGGGTISSEITYYFPLYEGYKTVYQVTEGSSQYSISYTVGKIVKKSNGDYLPWISYSPGRGADTGYFQAFSNELLYYENLGVGPERILVLPLTIGATWNRTTSLSTGGGDGIIIDSKYGDDPIVDSTNDNTGGFVAKNFPSTGEGTMEVVASETVTLSSGKTLTGSIKIVNRNNNGSYNQYWYAPGIGLVKYILGSPTSNSSYGAKSAEITSYDRR